MEMTLDLVALLELINFVECTSNWTGVTGKASDCVGNRHCGIGDTLQEIR